MRLAGLLLLTLSLLACKSSEPAATNADQTPDGAIGSDAASTDAGGDDTSTAGTDGGPSADSGPPPTYVEPTGKSSDPFLGGSAASTGISLGPSDSVTIAGTIASGGGNPAWADSDAYTFKVTAETNVQAELLFAPTGNVWSVAIHRADRTLVAWWGMATEGRALTHPKKLPPGDYFVHVAAAPPAPATPAPYTVRLRSGDLGDCATGKAVL